MIAQESFELFDKLLKGSKYHLIFDLSIIYQVTETLEIQGINLKDEDFKRLCNKVKRDYLKYDKELNDELVEEMLQEMGLWNE